MIGAVLFDLDGTLLDRKLAYRSFMADQCRRFASAMPGVTADAYLSAAVRADKKGTAGGRERFAGIGAELGLSEALQQRLLDDYWDGFARACTLFPRAAETLGALRAAGLRVGLITNGSSRMQGAKLDALGVRAAFDEILISGAEGCHKPDPAIFRAASERLGVSPAAAVFVGDNPEADVRGAKAFGMRAVWVRDHDYWPDAPPEADAIVDDVWEVCALVEGWRRAT